MVGDTVGIGGGEELSQERMKVECCKADDLSLNGIVVFTSFKPIVKMAAIAGGGAIFAKTGTVIEGFRSNELLGICPAR